MIIAKDMTPQKKKDIIFAITIVVMAWLLGKSSFFEDPARTAKTLLSISYSRVDVSGDGYDECGKTKLYGYHFSGFDKNGARVTGMICRASSTGWKTVTDISKGE